MPVVRRVSVVVVGSLSSFHLPKCTSSLFNLLWPLGCNKVFILLNKLELNALYVNIHVQATSDFKVHMACGAGEDWTDFFRISCILGLSKKHYSF